MRGLWSNNFYFNPASYTASESEVPFITSSELFASLVSERIKKPVVVIKDSIPSEHLVFEVEGTKEVWQEMLQESDNFLAEQLLLMAGEYQTGELNTERAIDYIQKTFLWDLPDQPNWMDGSGLSRNNLVTPRAMIQLMVKLEQLIPREELKSFLAVGGVNGTLKNTYKGSSPYIFAKTGTLSNNHSLVGIIKTDSGKHFAFAFMNNNYLQKASEVRREMEKVMVYVKQHL
jgi:serine-type D-Ala-D-Ala carboxypeptidase/endopeptidase (penicillin-binding protein 4)